MVTAQAHSTQIELPQRAKGGASLGSMIKNAVHALQTRGFPVLVFLGKAVRVVYYFERGLREYLDSGWQVVQSVDLNLNVGDIDQMVDHFGFGNLPIWIRD